MKRKAYHHRNRSATSKLSSLRPTYNLSEPSQVSADVFREDYPQEAPASHFALEDDTEDVPPANHFALEDYTEHISPGETVRDVQEGMRQMPDLLDILNVSSDMASDIPQVSSRPNTGVSLPPYAGYPSSSIDDSPAIPVDDPKAQSIPRNNTFHPTANDPFLVRLGLWADAVQLSHKDYTSLAQILKSASLDDLMALPKTMATLQNYRRHLPLATIFQKPVALNPAQLPQRICPTDGHVFFFDIQDTVLNMLKNQRLFQEMYFGPAQLTNELSEVWHGTHWAESIRTVSGTLPFYPDSDEAIFPSDCINYSYNSSVNLGRVRFIWSDCRKNVHNMTDPEWLIHIEPLVSYSAICPDVQASLTQSYPNELYLLEGQFHKITPSMIVRRISVWFKSHCDDRYTGPDYFVNTIVNAAQSKVRSAELRYPLIAENELRVYGRAMLQNHFVQRGSGRPILSIPTLLFVDGFGLYRNNYRSLLGMYLCAANLPVRYRRLPRNHAVLTLGPFAASLEDIVRCMATSLRKLDNGIESVINGEATWIHSTPLGITGDMPQQNRNNGVQSPSGSKFCRYCSVSKHDGKGVIDYDILLDARYPGPIQKIRAEATTSEELSSHGLGPQPSVWPQAFPAFEPVIQTPSDFNHTDVKGMGSRFQDVLFNLLSAKGERMLSDEAARATLPAGWSRLQNPISHRGSYSFTEVGRFSIILPFILRRGLKADCMKKEQLKLLQRSLQCSDVDELIVKVIKCFVRQAQCFSEASMSILSRRRTATLLKRVVQCRKDYCNLAESFTSKKDADIILKLQRLPNQHAALHLSADFYRYGTLFNVNSTIGEEMHRPFKLAAPFTNSVNPDLQLLRRVSILQCIRQIADGCFKEVSEYTWVSDVVLELKTIAPEFFSRIGSGILDLIPDSIYRSLDNTATKVHAGKRLRARDQNISLDTAMKQDLMQAYAAAGSPRGSISGSLCFYGSVSFTRQVRVHIHVSTDVLYKHEPAHVLSIISHIRTNGTQCIFLSLELWEFVKHDIVLETPLYKRSSNAILVALTTIEDRLPHLVQCKEKGLVWWNKWDVKFH